MVLQLLVVDLSMSRNERQTVASERPFGVQACELGLSLQGWKFDSQSSVSRGD
jgi:hypothetical protein